MYQRSIRTLRSLIPIAAYFFAAFLLLDYTRVLLREEYDTLWMIMGTALVGAFLVSVAVVIAETFGIMEPFPKIPITYNALWKALFYTQVVFILELVKAYAPVILRGQNITAAMDRIMSRRFLIVQIWVVVLMVIFCLFRELFHVLGSEKSTELLCGKHEPI